MGLLTNFFGGRGSAAAPFAWFDRRPKQSTDDLDVRCRRACRSGDAREQTSILDLGQLGLRSDFVAHGSITGVGRPVGVCAAFKIFCHSSRPMYSKPRSRIRWIASSLLRLVVML